MVGLWGGEALSLSRRTPRPRSQASLQPQKAIKRIAHEIVGKPSEMARVTYLDWAGLCSLPVANMAQSLDGFSLIFIQARS